MSLSSHEETTTTTSSPSPNFQHPLSRHLSTLHLETFRVSRSTSSVTPPVNNYVQSILPMSTFSTFAHNKSRTELRLQDDTNPYSVSRIDEFKIQVQDPYRMRTKSTTQLMTPSSPAHRNSSAHFYQELEDFEDEGIPEDPYVVTTNENIVTPNENIVTQKLHNLPSFYKQSLSTRNSSGYEMPDAEGSGGSSEDLPLPPSDTSEEYSHSLSISASSGSDGVSPVPSNFNDPDTLPPTPTPTKLPERDITRIQRALTGRKTEIFVSESMANLYYKSKTPPRPSSSGSTVTTTSSNSNSTTTTVQSESTVVWILKYTGVPVLLLDTGETKSRDKRKIQIVLAEIGSGLALWKDTIDHLSSYKVIGELSNSTFHTMHLSSDRTKVIGLSFDNEESADKFGKEVDRLTSDFANISLSGSKQKNKKENKGKDKKKGGVKWVRPNKNEISQPCCFQHVSTLSPKDKTLFSSLQHFVTGKSNPTPLND